MKRRERTEVEHLRGLVRKLKAENRHLKKLIGVNFKEIARFEEHFTEREEEVYLDHSPAVEERCSDCNGKLKYIDLGIRKLVVCEQCGRRLK